MDKDTKLKIALDALKEIKENYGQVCAEFEICKHIACQSSVGSWITADKALKEIEEKTND
jgi:hypothetical protein